MNSFTFESSFHGYINNERQTVVFEEENLQELGMKLGQVFYQYLNLLDEEEREAKQRREARRKKSASKRSTADPTPKPGAKPREKRTMKQLLEELKKESNED